MYRCILQSQPSKHTQVSLSFSPQHPVSPLPAEHQESEGYLNRKALRGNEDTKVSLLGICIFERSCEIHGAF